MDTLIAQIRARMAENQQQRIDLGESLSWSAADPLCDDADVGRAIDAFHDHPVRQTFSTAMACVLVHATQQFIDRLRTYDGTTVRWDNTSARVARYEAAAYLWSALAAEVRDSIRHEFEAERDAVAGGMLGAFGVVGTLIRQAWPGFSPEAYTLSRVMFYPGDLDEATEGFCRVLASSAALSLPLSAEEIRRAGQAPGGDGGDLLASVSTVRDRIFPDLRTTSFGFVSHYMSARLD